MWEATFPPFKPHPLLRSGHAQTIFSAYFPGVPCLPSARRIVVRLTDGDAVLLHDEQPAAWQPGDRVALLLHGLGGSHQSGYVVRMARRLHSRGIRTFRMDLRGCGQGFELAVQPGHAGRSEDAHASLVEIAAQCPGSPVTIIGYSMGANIALKMLGEAEDLLPAAVDSAITVAPPIDILACSRNMQLGLNRLYDQAFVRALLSHVRRRRNFAPALAELPLQPRPRSLYEFDNRFTAPQGGFRDAEDYYARAGAASVLPQIRVPVLILAAADDPIIPVQIFEKAKYSPTTRLEITEFGGHCGYIGRSGSDPDRRWLDWRVLQVIDRLPDIGLSAAKSAEQQTVATG